MFVTFLYNDVFAGDALRANKIVIFNNIRVTKAEREVVIFETHGFLT